MISRSLFDPYIVLLIKAVELCLLLRLSELIRELWLWSCVLFYSSVRLSNVKSWVAGTLVGPAMTNSKP